MGQLGNLLRETREAKGLSLEQVEATTCIRRKLLEALENEAYHELPAPVFVKGFLRNYAKLLGLDAEEVIGLYKATVGEEALTYTPRTLAEPLEPEAQPIPWPALILLLLLILVVAAWRSYQRGWLSFFSPDSSLSDHPAATTAVGGLSTPTEAPPTDTVTHAPSPTHSISPTPMPSATPTPTRTPSQTVTLAPVAGLRVELEILRDVWLRVYADGVPVFDGLAAKGSPQAWSAKQQLYVHCAEANAVRARVNGQLYGVLGKESDPVRVEWRLAPGTPSIPSTVSPTQIVLSSLTTTPTPRR